jgi:hypothetical protein
MLTSRMAEFGTQHAFKPGQMIQWKRGLRNRLRPAYGAPVVVVEVLEQPVYDKSRLKEGAGSAYYREPLTIVAGLLDNDGDLIFFHYDQRRMEPYEA